MTKVALSGAGGQVGGVLRPRLLERGVKLRSGGGLNPLTPLSDAEEVTHGDLREPEVVDRLLHGVDVLIHLAGTSVERPLPEIIENNLRALHEVYEGARRHGVKRIVFASSNHAFGMYSVTEKLSIDAPFRPRLGIWMNGWEGLFLAVRRMGCFRAGCEFGTEPPMPPSPGNAHTLATDIG